MGAPSYENALVAASDEMKKLLKQRSEIDARISQLKKTMEALSDLMKPLPSETPSYFDELGTGIVMGKLADAGISDAIRQVVSESKVPLTPVQIKELIANRGFDLSGYANAGTVIHNTLARLEKQGELVRLQNPGSQLVSYFVKYRRTVPPPPGIDPIEEFLGPVQRGEKPKEPRPQERFSLDHTRPTKNKQD